MRQRIASLLAAIVLVLALGSMAKADGIVFGTVAVLALGSPTSVNLSGSTITGGVGVATTGNFGMSGGAISGNLYLDQAGTYNNSGGTIGAVLQNAATDTLLAGWASSASSLSTTDAALSATINPPTSIVMSGGSQTITGGAGVNVLNLDNLIMSGGVLTLSAPSGGSFVVNDFGSFTLSGAQILLAGSLGPGDVVYNLTQGGSALSGSTMFGILLGRSGTIGISGSYVCGEVIGGGSAISISGGSNVVGGGSGDCGGTTPVPEPGTLTLLGTGLIAAAGFLRRKLAR